MSRGIGSFCWPGTGTFKASEIVGIGRKTGYRWRAENGGLPPARLAEAARSGRYLSLLEPQRIGIHHRSNMAALTPPLPACRRAAAGNWCAGAGLDDDQLDVPGYRPAHGWRAATGTGTGPPPTRPRTTDGTQRMNQRPRHAEPPHAAPMEARRALAGLAAPPPSPITLAPPAHTPRPRYRNYPGQPTNGCCRTSWTDR